MRNLIVATIVALGTSLTVLLATSDGQTLAVDIGLR